METEDLERIIAASSRSCQLTFALVLLARAKTIRAFFRPQGRYSESDPVRMVADVLEDLSKDLEVIAAAIPADYTSVIDDPAPPVADQPRTKNAKKDHGSRSKRGARRGKR